MSVPSRHLSVAGLALAALILVQWIRPGFAASPALVRHVVGALPNLAAAIGVPFLLTGLWAIRHPDATAEHARRCFARHTLLTVVGLVAWEFLQQYNRLLVFDPLDMAAALAGWGLAWLAFMALSARGDCR